MRRPGTARPPGGEAVPLAGCVSTHASQARKDNRMPQYSRFLVWLTQQVYRLDTIGAVARQVLKDAQAQQIRTWSRARTYVGGLNDAAMEAAFRRATAEFDAHKEGGA